MRIPGFFRIRKRILIFIGVNLVFALITTLLSVDTANLNERYFLKNFSDEANRVYLATENAFRDYAELANSGRGFIEASEFVERIEWEKYWDSIELEKNYPTVSAIKTIRAIKNNEESVKEFVESIKGDSSIPEKQRTAFKVFPESSGDMRYIVDLAYTTKLSERTLGYDFGSNPDILTALQLSRDNNSVTITQPVYLDQVYGRGAPMFIVILPIYSNSGSPAQKTLDLRRSSLSSYIVLEIKVQDVFSQLFLENLYLNQTNNIQVSDVTNADKSEVTTLPNISSQELSGKVFNLSKKLSFGGRLYQLDFQSIKYKTFSGSDFLIFIVPFLGLVISSIIWMVLSSSARTREEAVKLAEQLTRDLSKFKKAIESTSEQIIITDKNGLVLYANPATEKITGYSPQEIIGKKAGQAWGGQMPKEYYQNLWETITQKKTTFSGKIKNKRKDGTIYDANILISPAIDSEGNIKYFISVERDITAEQMAERAKDEFMDLASHQMRTPATGVKAFLSMLMDGDAGKLSRRQLEFASKAYDSNENQLKLINDLLSVARYEGGRFKILPTKFKFNTLISEVIEELKSQADDKKQKIQLELPSQEIEFIGDENKIQMAISNLVDNAIKYSPLNSKIKVSLRSDENSAVITISDKGIGINKEDLPKLFQKFYRAQNDETAKISGTGLGLYIVQKIIFSHGGKISVDSEFGRGTVFTVSLPRKEFNEN